MFKTSLQTITWGDPQHDRFSDIFALAKASGFDGLEIGFRRLREISVTEIRTLLDQHHMVINASHIGGNLGDLGQAENERADFDAALHYLGDLGVPYLLYSGLNEPNDDALEAAIEQLNGFAERCGEHGVMLLFHNHDWEFHNNQRIWKRLLEMRSTSLGYALDLGWAVKAGQDLSTLLDELGDSAKILHFKDFISAEAGQNTSHLGEGIIDFSPAWRWLDGRRGSDIWLTAEQDNAEDADIACGINGAYLAKHNEKLGRT
ncbi:MAG: sugar phosphate isomerase/epimerase family protein [Stappiaceae bacterium]